jgi:hypothetical protein
MFRDGKWPVSLTKDDISRNDWNFLRLYEMSLRKLTRTRI